LRILKCVPLVCLITVAAFASDNKTTDSKPADGAVTAVAEQPPKPADSGRVGVGGSVGLTGIGFETAVRINHRSNLRGGASFFSHRKDFTYDSLDLKGQLGLKTMHVQYDLFPRAGGFHISPGVLVFMGNPLSATAGTAPDSSFSLGNNDYTSGSTNPVSGNVKINFRRAAPMFTVGWGNLVSRREGKHLTVPFEVGVAMTGAPKAVYQLAGNVCSTSYDPVTGYPTQTCGPAASNKQFQQDVLTEQAKLNSDMSRFKVYPILKIGIGYKF
jgi:hypothetical protein